MLREIAQTPDEDVDAFQDVSRHRFFGRGRYWNMIVTSAVRDGWRPDVGDLQASRQTGVQSPNSLSDVAPTPAPAIDAPPTPAPAIDAPPDARPVPIGETAPPSGGASF